MPIFATEVRIFGTIYIKASDIDEGQQVLERLCTRTFDARDRVWFSDASFESLPQVSYSTSLTGDVVLPTAQLVEVSSRDVEIAQRSFLTGSRDYMAPNAETFVEMEDLPVFSVDVDIETTAFVKAKSSDAALVELKGFEGSHIELSAGYWCHFSLLAFDEEEDLPPIALSSALKLLGPSNGQ